MFGFQELDVYRCSIAFLSAAAGLSHQTERGYASLGDQLRRAALSIPLHIAEGNGKYDQEARRFYVIARGSALECAAILDAYQTLHFAPAADLEQPRQLLYRIVSMLSGMLRS